MEVVLLSQCPDLLIECAELLNKQWKRSTSARVQSLEKSFTCLPDSLLLIEDKSNSKKVIGHSRLTRVLEDPTGCWIGSVVISEDERKKGYGKYLMQKTEEYAKVLQFSTAYLNTHDQQGFYEHLGYSYCEPVSSVNFTWNIENFSTAPKNIAAKSLVNSYTDAKSLKNDNIDQTSTPSCVSPSISSPVATTNKNFTMNSKKNENIDLQTSTASPPIPPPMPTANRNLNLNNNLKSNLGQYWMKKKL